MGEKAVLLSFRLNDNRIMNGGRDLQFLIKSKPNFQIGAMNNCQGGVRVVPPAVARKGSYIAKGAILMPSTSISAPMSMKAQWSIRGRRWVHAPKSVKRPLSDGVGIGGVLTATSQSNHH